MPLALGGVVMLVMYTWRRGSRLLFEKSRRAGDIAARAGRDAGKESADAGAGHRRLPHQRSDQCADGTDAQFEALQGAARKERHSHDRDRRYPKSSRKTAFRSSRSATISPASRCISATWRRPTCRRHWRSRASSAGSSTLCRPRSFCRAVRSSLPRNPRCRAGKTGCSFTLRAVQTMRPTISRFRPGAWSRLVRRSRFKATLGQSSFTQGDVPLGQGRQKSQ